MGQAQELTIGEALSTPENYVAFMELCRKDKYLSSLYQHQQKMESLSLRINNDYEESHNLRHLICMRIVSLQEQFIKSL